MYLAEKLNDEIFYYKNVINNPSRIIELINELDLDETTYPVIPKWKGWISNSSDGRLRGGDKEFFVNNLPLLISPRKNDVTYILDTIRSAINDTATAYYRDRGFDGTPNTSPFIGIKRYDEGCFLGPHFDTQSGDKSLKYSMVLYFNDDYEGGELSFIVRDYDLRDPENGHLVPNEYANHPDNQGLIDFTLKPEPGSVLIFPSHHPYMHQVHMVTAGSKYMFPGFIFIDDYNPANPDSIKKYNGGSSEYVEE